MLATSPSENGALISAGSASFPVGAIVSSSNWGAGVFGTVIGADGATKSIVKFPGWGNCGRSILNEELYVLDSPPEDEVPKRPHP